MASLKDLTKKAKDFFFNAIGVNDGKPFIQSPVGQKVNNFKQPLKPMGTASTPGLLQPFAKGLYSSVSSTMNPLVQGLTALDPYSKKMRSQADAQLLKARQMTTAAMARKTSPGLSRLAAQQNQMTPFQTQYASALPTNRQVIGSGVKTAGLALSGGLGVGGLGTTLGFTAPFAAYDVKKNGGNFSETLGRQFGDVLPYSGIASKLTTPFISKFAPTGILANRVGQGVLNASESVGLDLATGNKVGVGNTALAFATGLAGRPFQGNAKGIGKINLEEISNINNLKRQWELNKADFNRPNPSKNIIEEWQGIFKKKTYPSLPTLSKKKGPKPPDIEVMLQDLTRYAEDKLKLARLQGQSMGIYGGKSATGFKNAPNKFSNLTDKKVRFEIDDSKAKIKDTNIFDIEDRLSKLRSEISPLNSKWMTGKTTPAEMKRLDELSGEINKLDKLVKTNVDLKLGDILKHDELYKQYPEAKNINVKFSTYSPIQGSGSYNSKTNVLTVDKEMFKNDPEGALGTILHEIEHSVQTKEIFANGGSPAEFIVKKTPAEDKELYDLFKKESEVGLSPTEQTRKNDLTGGGVDGMFASYQRLAGEVEARDVQSRMKLTPQQRASTSPLQSQGIPLKDQIVRFDSGISQSKDAQAGLYDVQTRVQQNIDSGMSVEEAVKKAGAESTTTTLKNTTGGGGRYRVSASDFRNPNDPWQGLQIQVDTKTGKISFETQPTARSAGVEIASETNLSPNTAKELVDARKAAFEARGTGMENTQKAAERVAIAESNAIEEAGLQKLAMYDLPDGKSIPGSDASLYNKSNVAQQPSVKAGLYDTKLTPEVNKLYQTYKNIDDATLADTLNTFERTTGNFKDTPAYIALKKVQSERSGIVPTAPQAQVTSAVDLKGFGSNLDPKNKSRAIKILSEKTRIDGGSDVITKSQKIEKLLNEGYKPTTVNGKTVLQKTGGNYYEITKIESDYAKHLQPQINVAQQPLSVPKGANIPKKIQGTVNTELNTPKISSQGVPSSDNIIHLKSMADGERQIDNLLGTSGMATGNWKQDYYYRQKAIEEIKAVAPPEVVAQVEKIQSAIDNLKHVRQEVDNVPSQQLNELKLKAEYSRLENKFSKTVKGLDKLKLDPKYFQIGKDELGRSKSVSVIPNEKVQTKLANNLESAKVKTEAQNYKEWQKQVFGEANTRTSTKAIEELGKQIKSSTNQGILDNADNWKDKPKIFLTRETMERNIEDIAGKDAPMVKEKLIQPIFKAEAERNRFLNKERADIKNLGIKARSKDSALVQELGEGKITVDEVKKRSSNADKVINAEQVLRQKYDSYLTQLNTVLTRNGYDPIPKRKDYFHHFEDLNGAFEQIGVAIKANDLPTDINGLSADFKPGKTFFTAALKRKGDQTSIDAITGIDKYLEGASNQIYHTDNIQNLRSFETALREKYAGTEHLTNFVADLGEYTNKLAGKKSMVDRAAESIVGRKIYTAANALKSQTGANMVGANVSSALTNFIPVTQTLATTDKPSVAQAMMGILKNSFKDDGFIDSSNFLTSRIGSDRLSMTNWQKIGQGGNWLFKTIDSFTSQLAVRSKYLEGIKKGLSEGQAMRNADDWGRKVLGGRAAGEVPTLFNSKTLGFLTQFQLEVNNQMSFMGKDIPRNFSKLGATSALAQVFLYSYIYNNLYEKITGRRPAFDPLGVVQDTYEDYTNPNMKSGQATKNTIKRVGEQLPFSSIATGGRIPIGSAIPNPMAVISGESTVGKEIKKPLYYLLPPTGGGQIKKAVEGLSAYSKGASVSDSGRVRYPIPQTATNAVRTGLFGQYSTPEAQQYFREGRGVLGEKQSQFLLNSNDKVGVYNKVVASRQDQPSGDVSTTTKGNIYQYMDDKGTVKEIDLSFPIKEYKPTGNTLLDKELLSDYKGSITTAKNNVMKAWELGAIDQGEAIKQLERLVSKANKTKKGKKPKKISIKISKPKTVKISKSKPFKGSRALVRKTPVYKIAKARKPKNISIAVGKTKIPAYKIKKFTNTLAGGSTRLA